MIIHIIGSDSRFAFLWTDVNGIPIPISAATLTVTARDPLTDGLGNPILDDNNNPILATITLSSELTYSDGEVRVHIQDTDTTAQGNYGYVVTATSGTDKQVISAGLLRIKQP